MSRRQVETALVVMLCAGFLVTLAPGTTPPVASWTGDDIGFYVPKPRHEAKTQIAWRDRDTLFVGTDFGEGSMTESGYPRLVKLWRRGTDLSEAETVATAANPNVRQ